MMNKGNKLNQVVVANAMKTMGFRDEYEASNYLVGFYRGLLNHLERSIPGVEKELENEILRQQRKNY